MGDKFGYRHSDFYNLFSSQDEQEKLASLRYRDLVNSRKFFGFNPKIFTNKTTILVLLIIFSK